MEIAHFLVNLLILFFQALNAGKTNASLAIASIILLAFGIIFIGVLLSNKKIVRIALFCQAILLSVIFMIYNQWIIVLVIAVGIVLYRQKFSGKMA